MRPHLFLFLAISASSAVLNLAVAGTIEVTSTGVGIGTATPAAPLHVYGPNLLARFESSAASSLIYFSPASSWDEYRIGAGVVNVNDWGVQNMTRSTTPFVITGGASGGNVGVGTASPGTRKLNVQSPDSTNDVGVEIALGRPTGTNYALITSASGSGADLNQGILATARNGASNFGLRVWNVLATANNYTLYCDSPAQSYFQGNVGIGTASPNYKLEVLGSVRATSFIANSNTYADFVFKPDYKLRSLSDVEAAIKIRGHLPDIPSEAEAKARGIDLAQMQVKLLQKVEELTLYLVVHDKKLQAQEQDLHTQKQAVQKLQTENEALRHLLSKLQKR